MNGKRHFAEGVKWPGNPGHLARRTSCSGSALGLRISRSTLHQSLAHIHANASLVIMLLGAIREDLLVDVVPAIDTAPDERDFAPLTWAEQIRIGLHHHSTTSTALDVLFHHEGVASSRALRNRCAATSGVLEPLKGRKFRGGLRW